MTLPSAVDAEVRLWSAYVDRCVEDVREGLNKSAFQVDTKDHVRNQIARDYRSAVRALWNPSSTALEIISCAGIDLYRIRESLLVEFEGHENEHMLLTHVISEGGKI